MGSLNENTLELATVDYFRTLGYQYAHGPEIAPDGASPERENYAQVVLLGRLRNTLGRINPGVPTKKPFARLSAPISRRS
ncbi:MAG: type I restriction endonuclease [Nitrospinota bacterium]|nr:type I restriction endonuclease [Nitrospinota bacterium]